ncbi:MAG: hypothetical protein QXD88_00445 [Candidatus Anstonellales archaeon]
MNIVFRDGAYIPIDSRKELPNTIDYNSLIGRYLVELNDNTITIDPKISPVLFLTRDLYWSGDHFIIYQGEEILLNYGAKIFNHMAIDFNNSDFRLNDIDLESYDQTYSIYELYNTSLRQNSIGSFTIGEDVYEAELMNVIHDSINSSELLCYRTLVFTPKVSIPRGNVTIMGLLEKNIAITTTDSVPMNTTTYLKIYQNPIIKAHIKSSMNDNMMNIQVYLENTSNTSQELRIILELNTYRVVDYEGEMEYRDGVLFRDIILSPHTKKTLDGTLIF